MPLLPSFMQQIMLPLFFILLTASWPPRWAVDTDRETLRLNCLGTVAYKMSSLAPQRVTFFERVLVKALLGIGVGLFGEETKILLLLILIYV